MKPLIAKVQFEKNNTTYSYYVPEGDEPKVGDRVITSTSSDLSFEQGYPLNMKMARVINILYEDDGKANKYYLWLMSIDEMKRRVEASKEAAKKRAELKALKEQMDERIKGKLDLDRYRKYASEDAELAAMVAKFEELSK